MHMVISQTAPLLKNNCTITEEQLQYNEEMDIQMEGLNDIENDEGLDDGKQNDDWNEEADTV